MFLQDFYFSLIYLLLITCAIQFFDFRKLRVLLLLFTSLIFLYLTSPFSLYFFIIAGLIHLFSFKNNLLNKKILGSLFIISWIGIFIYFKMSRPDFTTYFLKKNISSSEIIPFGFSYCMFFWLSYVLEKIDTFEMHDQPSALEVFCLSCFIGSAPAGPFLRPTLLKQELFKKPLAVEIQYGFALICWGLFKKFLSDELLLILNNQPAWLENGSRFDSWSIALSYPARFYLDFSGISDIAIGIGLLFGLKIQQNFNLPFLAKDVTDYWRRWHISLGDWFKTHVYLWILSLRYKVPWIKKLSANWLSTTSTGAVFLLIGIWHGYQINFIIWSVYVFLCLLLSAAISPFLLLFSRWLGIAVTFYLMMWGQIILTNSSPVAVFNKWLWMHTLISSDEKLIFYNTSGLLPIFITAIILPHYIDAKIKVFFSWSNLIRFLVLTILMTLAFCFGKVSTPFLYSRF